MTHSDSHTHGGEAHGSVKEYVIGLILSIILTVIPFALVMHVVDQGGMVASGLSPSVVVGTVILCCIGQLLVQAVFFLHMNGSSESRWNIMSSLYIVFVVLAFVIGSIWIFEHLNHNMLMGH